MIDWSRAEYERTITELRQRCNEKNKKIKELEKELEELRAHIQGRQNQDYKQIFHG